MKHLAIYGACGGLLIVAMRFVEYRFLVVSHSVEIYAALIAAAFAAVGIWMVTYNQFFPDFPDNYAAYLVEDKRASGASQADAH